MFLQNVLCYYIFGTNYAPESVPGFSVRNRFTDGIRIEPSDEEYEGKGGKPEDYDGQVCSNKKDTIT